MEEEWEVRKGTQYTIEMRGFSPSVPQQNNSSDCGIYLLQYVESFFEVCGYYGVLHCIRCNRPRGLYLFWIYRHLFVLFSSLFKSPLQSFKAPIDLNKWFPQSRVAKKREEIRELILNIQNEQKMAEKVKDGVTTGR